jgi:hypothetical protein
MNTLLERYKLLQARMGFKPTRSEVRQAVLQRLAKDGLTLRTGPLPEGVDGRSTLEFVALR